MKQKLKPEHELFRWLFVIAALVGIVVGINELWLSCDVKHSQKTLDTNTSKQTDHSGIHPPVLSDHDKDNQGDSRVIVVPDSANSQEIVESLEQSNESIAQNEQQIRIERRTLRGQVMVTRGDYIAVNDQEHPTYVAVRVADTTYNFTECLVSSVSRPTFAENTKILVFERGTVFLDANGTPIKEIYVGDTEQRLPIGSDGRLTNNFILNGSSYRLTFRNERTRLFNFKSGTLVFENWMLKDVRVTITYELVLRNEKSEFTNTPAPITMDFVASTKATHFPLMPVMHCRFQSRDDDLDVGIWTNNTKPGWFVQNNSHRVQEFPPFPPDVILELSIGWAH